MLVVRRRFCDAAHGVRLWCIGCVRVLVVQQVREGVGAGLRALALNTSDAACLQ